MIRRLAISLGAASLALSMATTTAFAGQPSQNCDNFALQPAGFSSGGFATAEGVYANLEAQGGIASGNGHVVSQYDVACEQVTLHH